MVKSIKSNPKYIALKIKWYRALKSNPDSGTCSLGHGTEIMQNGKKIDFWDATRYTQSNTPVWMAENQLEDDFKELGLIARHEAGRMD